MTRSLQRSAWLCSLVYVATAACSSSTCPSGRVGGTDACTTSEAPSSSKQNAMTTRAEAGNLAAGGGGGGAGGFAGGPASDVDAG
jgi:hypothetical protein